MCFCPFQLLLLAKKTHAGMHTELLNIASSVVGESARHVFVTSKPLYAEPWSRQILPFKSMHLCRRIDVHGCDTVGSSLAGIPASAEHLLCGRRRSIVGAHLRQQLTRLGRNGDFGRVRKRRDLVVVADPVGGRDVWVGGRGRRGRRKRLRAGRGRPVACRLHGEPHEARGAHKVGNEGGDASKGEEPAIRLRQGEDRLCRLQTYFARLDVEIGHDKVGESTKHTEETEVVVYAAPTPSAGCCSPRNLVCSGPPLLHPDLRGLSSGFGYSLDKEYDGRVAPVRLEQGKESLVPVEAFGVHGQDLAHVERPVEEVSGRRRELVHPLGELEYPRRRELDFTQLQAASAERHICVSVSL